MTIQRYGWDTKSHAIIARLEGVIYPDSVIGYYILDEDYLDALETQREEWRDNKRDLENDVALKQEQIVVLTTERDTLHEQRELLLQSTHVPCLVAANAKQTKQITALKSDLETNAKLLANQCDMAREAETALAEKDVDWQLKYDILINDYEQKWGLSMRLQEQIVALTKRLRNILYQGHNDDCLFCGFKDKIAQEALRAEEILGPQEPLGEEFQRVLDANRDKLYEHEALRDREEEKNE